MAITGRFEADFAAFHAAVQGAEVQLRSFEAGSNKVESALSKMTDAFSGRKVIQDATLMAEAVERIGGTSKLTASELARIEPVAAEALAKMRAMGIEVPPGLQKIADETKGVTAAQNPLLSIVTQVAVGFAALFTARAAANFVNQTIAEASALSDLSAQTHVNVEELQLLGGAMSDFGVDADELGKGLFGLSQKIAGGDQSVARGLHTMGLSLKEVEGLQGQELFLKIERGLSTLQGGLRDTAATDLFGAKLGAAMAGASEGIEGALESARRLNTVMSAESVAALDAYGESIERMQRNLSAMGANLLGPVAQGFNVLNDAADRGASKWALLNASYIDWLNTTLTGQTHTEALTKLLDDQAQAQEKTAAAQRGANAASTERVVILTAQQQAVQFMAALEADAATALTEQQLLNLAHLKEIGALTAANANAIGINADQFAKYQVEQAASAEATKKWKEAIEEITSVGTSWRTTLDTLDGEVVEGVKSYLAAGVALDKLKVIYELTDAQAKAIELSFKADAEATKQMVAAVDTLSAAWARSYAEGQTLGATDSDRFRQKAEADYQALVASLQKQGDAIEAHYDQAWAIYQQDVEQGNQARLEQDTNSRQFLANRIKYEADYLAFMKTMYGEYTATALEAQAQVVESLQTQLAMWGAIQQATEGEIEKVRALGDELRANESFSMDLPVIGQFEIDTTPGGADALLAELLALDERMKLPVESASQYYQRLKDQVRYESLKAAYELLKAQSKKNRGAQEGGWGDFGTGTDVMLHGREAIVPLDRPPPGGLGLGTTVTNHFYVNGTATDVANQIAAELMKQLKQIRQFGAA